MVKHISFCILIFIVSFLVVFDKNYQKIFSSVFENNTFLYSKTGNIGSNDVITMVFITSSSCQFSNTPELYRQIDEIKFELSHFFNQKDYSFKAIGIAIDYSVESGISHLKKFGHFDEIISGNGWENTGAKKYIEGDIRGVPVTPQIVITKSKTEFDDSEEVHNGVNEQQIIRRVGLNNIKRWFDFGLPIPSNAELNNTALLLSSLENSLQNYTYC